MKVLVVVDMQNDFIDGALANPAAQAIVDDIAEVVKEPMFDAVVFTKRTILRPKKAKIYLLSIALTVNQDMQLTAKFLPRLL